MTGNDHDPPTILPLADMPAWFRRRCVRGFTATSAAQLAFAFALVFACGFPWSGGIVAFVFVAANTVASVALIVTGLPDVTIKSYITKGVDQ